MAHGCETIGDRRRGQGQGSYKALMEPCAPRAAAHATRSMPREGARVKYWLLCCHCRRRRAFVTTDEHDTHQYRSSPRNRSRVAWCIEFLEHRHSRLVDRRATSRGNEKALRPAVTQ